MAPACAASSQCPLAALEVPLDTPQDRTDFLEILKDNARANGLHVDDASRQWREFLKNVKDQPPTSPVEKTIYISLWRAPDENNPEVLVDDGGHQGRPWIIFYNGRRVDSAEKDRHELTSSIRRRWPQAINIPIKTEGGLPTVEEVESPEK